MTRLGDITSTEKLLGVIRSKKGEDPAPADSSPVEAQPKKNRRFKFPSPSVISLQKSTSVGIDIGHDYLHIVKVGKISTGKWSIIDRRRMALPPKTPRDSPEFAAFLKSALASVCGSAKQSDRWVIMSAARVEVRHVRIPKVAKKLINNVVYWTARKETPFDENEMVLDFETQGEVIEQGIPKLAVMVYTAPRQEIEDLKNLFTRIGWPLTGISIVPFSTQNLFRTEWIPTLEGTIASLFIGNDFSRIDIYAEGNLVMTRGIKAGVSSMVEALVDRFNEMKIDPLAPALTPEQGRKIVRSLSPDSPPLEKTDAGFDIKKEDLFEMIQPALERLTRQVERTFEHHASTMPSDQIARIFVSGAMNIYQPIIDYVGAQLGITSAVLDPLSNDESGFCVDEGDIHCVSERVALGPALGLALSSNEHTPNLMFTYKDKERKKSIKRINQTVFVGFIAVVLICSGVFTYQYHEINQKKAVLKGLETQLARLGPPVDRNQLLKLVANINQRRELSKIYADRYLGMVLISELATLTPANIRFIDLKINLAPAAAPAAGDAAKSSPKEAPKARVEEVIAEGLILGERRMFETSLAGYTMAMEASPIFRQVTIQKSNVEPYLKGEALHFILNMKVEEQVHG